VFVSGNIGEIGALSRSACAAMRLPARIAAGCTVDSASAELQHHHDPLLSVQDGMAAAPADSHETESAVQASLNVVGKKLGLDAGSLEGMPREVLVARLRKAWGCLDIWQCLLTAAVSLGSIHGCFN